jgi:hypothetical protein
MRPGRSGVEPAAHADRPDTRGVPDTAPDVPARPTVHVDERTRATTAPPAALWRVVEGIGGDRGWYSATPGWRARGLLDRAVGGVGMRRGRRDPDRLEVGDAVDFWRVEHVERGRLLRLRAEMRMPGTARLEFHVEHDGSADGGRGATVLRQRVTFTPHGRHGSAYWWASATVHGVLFRAMVRDIARAAERG